VNLQGPTEHGCLEKGGGGESEKKKVRIWEKKGLATFGYGKKTDINKQLSEPFAGEADRGKSKPIEKKGGRTSGNG